MAHNTPIVWSREDRVCVACRQTIRFLESLGHSPVIQPLTDEAAEKFREAGFLTAPIVEWAGEQWAGFQPDRIRDIINAGTVPVAA